MFHGKKILIVEDSMTVRYQIRLILGKQGVELLEVANELGLFGKVEEYGKKVDLIIMDVTLKNENGLDLVQKLKASAKYNDIPVLILTEHANRDIVLQAKELGVQGFLRKPIEKDLLLDRIKGILEGNFTAVPPVP